MDLGSVDTRDDTRQGRHRRGAAESSWTPTVPKLPAVAAQHARHVGAPRITAARAAEPGDQLPAQRATALDNSIEDTDVFPNLRPGRHAAAALVGLNVGAVAEPPPAPIAVLEPVEYAEQQYPEFAEPETDMCGLRKFNLGTVPASVTPPKSWRKAAWFSVLSSAAALAALVTISAAFVNHEGTRTTIGALPALPPAPVTSSEHPDNVAGAPTSTDDTTTTAPDTSTTTDADGDGVPDTSAQHPHTGNPGSGGGAGGGTGPGGGATTGGGTSSAPATMVPNSFPPETVTFDDSGPAMMDGGAASNASHEFYAEIAKNPEAALADTDMSHAQRQRVMRAYRHVRAVQVTRRVVYASAGMTRNTLVLYNDDGTTEHVTRTLYFSPGDDPEITGELS